MLGRSAPRVLPLVVATVSVAAAILFGAQSARSTPTPVTPVCAAGTCTVTFLSSPSPTWNVPPVATASVTLYGAQGAASPAVGTTPFTLGPIAGGLGAEATQTIPIVGGDPYTVTVGTAGAATSGGGGGGGATWILSG